MNTLLVKLKPRPSTAAAIAVTGLADAQLYRIETKGISKTRVVISRADLSKLADRIATMDRALKIAEERLREQDDWKEKYLLQEKNYEASNGPDDRPRSSSPASYLARLPQKMVVARQAVQGGLPSLGKRSR